MSESLSLSEVFGIAFIVIIMFLFTRAFSKMIRVITLKAPASESVKELLKSQSLIQKLFMTYMRKYIPERKRDAGLLICMLTFYYIHITASAAFLAMILGEVFCEAVFNRTVDASAYIVGSLTFATLGDIAFRLAIFTFPACFIIGIIYEIAQRKRKDND